MRLFNKLYGLLPLSLLLSLAACTSETGEQPVKPTPEPSGGSARREVMLTLKNKLSVAATKAVAASATPGATAAAPSTKAETPIATAGENKIESLDIYVFGSATEDGEYTYQERLCYRAESSDIPSGDDVTAFELNASGATAKEATALLTIRKGLFVKLYCLANQSKLTGEDGQPAVTFRPLVQSAPGQTDNLVTEGSPTEEEFLQYRSPLLSATAEADTLTPPLPMTGAYTTPLDLTDFSVSARLQMGFRLTRAVARFDVVNDAETSRFTIQSVSLVKGRRGVSFFPLKVLGSVPAGGNELITYPVRTFWGENANKGICTGAFYTYPSPSEDEAYLVLNGIYATNKTDKVPVTYQVPFKPVGDGNYIEVTQNHRYTVNITAADEYHLDFTLDVADWKDEGSIDDYTPGGEGETTALKVDVGVGGDNTYDEASRTVTMAITAGSQFTITGGSTSGYLTRLYYKDNDTEHQWLTMTPPADYMPATKADAGPTTYTIARKEGYTGNSFPLAFIRFTDKTTLQETVVIVQPIADPVLTQKAISAGSTFDLDNGLITLYKKADVPSPSVTFTALVSGGNILKFTDADTPGNWLQVTPSEMQSDAAQMEYIMAPNTSAADFPNPFPVEGKAFTITNKGDDTKKTTMTLKLKSDLIVTPEKEGNAGFENDKLTLYDHAEDKVKLTVNTISGSEIVEVSDWLTVEKENENKNTTTYIFSVAENGYVGTGGSFVIRSKADNTISKRYSVESKSTAVTVTAKNLTSGSTFADKTVTLYQKTSVDKPSVTFSVDASAGSQLTFPAGTPAWLNITPSGLQSDNSTSEYKIELNTSNGDFPTLFPADGIKMKFTNKGNANKTEEITLKAKSDITVTSSATEGQAVFNSSSSTITLYNEASAKMKLTLKSIGGTEIVNAPGWLTVEEGNNLNEKTYTLYVKDNGTTGVNQKITFRSKLDNSIVKEYTVNSVNKSTMTFSYDDNSDYSSIDNINNGTPAITYFPCANSYSQLTVVSSKGVTVNVSSGWATATVTSTTPLSTGEIRDVIKITRTQSDSYYSNLLQSNFTVKVSSKYPSQGSKSFTVKQYQGGIVYPESTLPANLVNGNSSFWVAPVSARGITSYSDFYAKVNSTCPTGWRVPTLADGQSLTQIVQEGHNIYHSWSTTLGQQLQKAFGSDAQYWINDTHDRGYGLYFKSSGYAIWTLQKNNGASVRCIINK